MKTELLHWTSTTAIRLEVMWELLSLYIQYKVDDIQIPHQSSVVIPYNVAECLNEVDFLNAMYYNIKYYIKFS